MRPPFASAGYRLLKLFLCSSIVGVRSFPYYKCTQFRLRTSERSIGRRSESHRCSLKRTTRLIHAAEQQSSVGSTGASTPAWLAAKQGLRLTYAQRKRTQQGLQSAREWAWQQCLNFVHGALHVIVNFDAVVFHSALPSTLCVLGVSFLATNSFFLYRVYWIALNSLFFAAEMYNIVANTVSTAIGGPILAIFMLPFLLSFLLLDVLSAGAVRSAVGSTLVPAAFAMVQTDTFGDRLDLSITCFFAPIQEEVFFRLIPALLAAALLRRTKMRTGVIAGNKLARRFCALFSVMFGAAHIGNNISFGTTLAETSLLTIQSITGITFSSWFFAAHTLLPLYRSRGFAAAVGAHAAWNTVVAFGDSEFFIRLLLCATVARLLRKTGRFLKASPKE